MFAAGSFDSFSFYFANHRAYNNTVEQEAKQYEIFSASGVKYSVRKHMSAWFHFSIEGYMDCNGVYI